MNDLFIKAVRAKLRFQVKGSGNISVEDLWDLGLERLDALAIAYNKELKDSEGESFIKPKGNKNTELTLQFKIVKFVIVTKLAEAEAKKVAKDKAEKRAQILELMKKKELSTLESKTLEELEKELVLLDAQ